MAQFRPAGFELRRYGFESRRAKCPGKTMEAAALAAQQQSSSTLVKLFYGLVMGLLGYTVVVKRRPIIDFARKLMKK